MIVPAAVYILYVLVGIIFTVLFTIIAIILKVVVWTTIIGGYLLYEFFSWIVRKIRTA